jgi:hypothetical protein
MLVVDMVDVAHGRDSQNLRGMRERKRVNVRKNE